MLLINIAKTKALQEEFSKNFFKAIDRCNSLSKMLNKYHICCPDCNTRQIQLWNYRQVPALWRCRHCKKIFDWEE